MSIFQWGFVLASQMWYHGNLDVNKLNQTYIWKDDKFIFVVYKNILKLVGKRYDKTVMINAVLIVVGRERFVWRKWRTGWRAKLGTILLVEGGWNSFQKLSRWISQNFLIILKKLFETLKIMVFSFMVLYYVKTRIFVSCFSVCVFIT